ncbi:MAG: hypothetical protein LIO90_08455 [Bacteroidales bacterium]|nr:hypothetical protein [Bacteroidales bacterium]
MATVSYYSTDFLHDAARLLAQGLAVTIPVKGSSMKPFLREATDTVTIKRRQGVSRGDIVLALYQGRFVLHRVCHCEGSRLTLRGDHVLDQGEIVDRGDVMGTAVARQRHGRTLSLISTRYRLLSRLWIWALPLRRLLHSFRHAR